MREQKLISRIVGRIAVIGVLVLSACLNGTTNTINDIEDESFNIFFREWFPNQATEFPEMVIALSSTKDFNCSNYWINTDYEIDGNTITIDFLSIEIGTVCSTAMGPATGIIPIDLTEGTYNLELKNGSVTETFQVVVTEESFTISGNTDSDSFIISNEIVYRFPEKSFALVGGTDTDNQFLYENFLDSIKTNFEIEEFTFAEDGYIPYPDSGSGHNINYPSSYFTYADEDDFQSIGNYLIDYSSRKITSDSGVSIAIYNWKNYAYRSWYYYTE